jgi:hypothetical protein
MKRYLVIVSLLLTTVLVVSTPEGTSAKMNDPDLRLPESVGLWIRPESAQVIHADNIFEYMDGAGELYLGYRFRYLEVYPYSAEDREDILVELYFMETPQDAFGLLSLDWSGDPVGLIESAVPEEKPSMTPANRALYGAGLLRLCADKIYARVMAFRETPESKEAVLSLGRAIATGRKGPPEPSLLELLPPKIGADWTLRRDRIGYFRSYLVLNSLHYLSDENILNLDLATEAVTAPYKGGGDSKGRGPIQVLIVKYPDPALAEKALYHFHEAYLPEHPKDSKLGLTSRVSDFFEVEDSWLGYMLSGSSVAMVFECPDEQTARKGIGQLRID